MSISKMPNSNIKAVILAGCFGTRLSEETHLRPKPMIEIGGKPILWHILKIYSHYGINDFIICLGYKGYLIKEFFANYALHTSDVTYNLQSNSMEVHSSQTEPWKVTLVDTGPNTLTGGRLARIKKYLNNGPFCFTYGDGVGDVNINELIEHHKNSNLLATLTSVQPPGRFGALKIKGNQVNSFNEKPSGDNAWISGGFFVLELDVIDLISGDQCSWEEESLELLAAKGQLGTYKHNGFWQPMDTLRDHKVLENHWATGKAPWKIWE